MKREKGLRRFILPIILIGLGVFIGTSIADSSTMTIEYAGAIGEGIPHAEHVAELRELEATMNEVIQDLQQELNLSIAERVEVPAQPQAPKIVIENVENQSHSNQLNVGLISALMGGFGVSAILIMALMTFSSVPRASTRDSS